VPLTQDEELFSVQQPRSALIPPGRRAIFLDKDGTLIEDVPYNVAPDKIRLNARAGKGLSALHAAGYRFVVVSNQSGVARGLFAEDALLGVERRLNELLADFGVRLSGFYYCPHPEETAENYRGPCGCRKPAPGLLTRAAGELDLDLGESWLIGDILHDIEAGRRAGCRSVLLDNGHETEWRDGPWRRPHYLARDLADAARIILAAHREGEDGRGGGQP
jgi:D-glycero-D-manno-heptose 1,7-bisphosphate phosphatase